ncbi:MAG: tetratricopeptide repeat protein [Candidatus Eisenbacteria bacterium]|nr:tetratricopeptide repeat protein [Candidatus Eisenbacteria bacterium]
MRARLDIELSSAAGGEPLVVELSWSEGIRPSTPRSHRGDTAPLVTLFALFCHTAQQAGSPPGLTAPVDSETGRVLRRVQQLLLDATPTRGRNKWIRQLFGPHPLHLLGESGWEGHNALSALVEISGKSVLVATLNTEYLQPEDIRFHTGKAQLSRSEIGTWLTSVGVPVPSVDRRSRSDAVDALVRLATGLKQSGQWHEALETFHRAAELARLEHRHSEESVCLRSIGEIALTRVPPAEARRWLERAIETARLSGDREGEATTLLSLGTLEQFEMNLAAARGHLEHAALLFRDLGRPVLEGRAEARLGHFFIRVGDIHAARRSLERSEYLFRTQNDIGGVASALVPQITLLSTQGDYEGARKLAARARALYDEAGAPQGRAIAAVASANLELDLDELDRAEELYAEAARIYDGLGHRSGKSNAEWGVGECLRRKGKIDEARALFVPLLRACIELENIMGHASVLWSLSRCALASGNLQEARELVEEAIRVCHEQKMPLMQSNLYTTLGEIEGAARRPAAARVAFATAQQSHGRNRDPLDRAQILMARGNLELDYDRREAIRCFYQAAGIFSELGFEDQERNALDRAAALFPNESPSRPLPRHLPTYPSSDARS